VVSLALFKVKVEVFQVLFAAEEVVSQALSLLQEVFQEIC
jgi:hypothetical protein